MTHQNANGDPREVDASGVSGLPLSLWAGLKVKLAIPATMPALQRVGREKQKPILPKRNLLFPPKMLFCGKRCLPMNPSRILFRNFLGAKPFALVALLRTVPGWMSGQVIIQELSPTPSPDGMPPHA